MPIRVLAAIIQRDGRVLICKRPAHKRHGDLWEFPGGKVEPEETDLEAARRELNEELALHVTAVGPTTFAVADPGSDFVIEFLPVEAEGDPQCLEHTAAHWVTDDELPSYDLAPSDRRYVEHRLTALATNPGN